MGIADSATTVSGVSTLIFPSSFFDRDRVDEDMAAEYEAAVRHFQIIFFDYDAWFNEGRLRLSAKTERPVRAIYRGWMMQPEQYKDFYEKLSERNLHLITAPGMYETLHLFPRVYPLIREDTARILTFPLHAQIDVRQVGSQFKRFIVKDYVKSVKGTEFPNYFDNSVTQEVFDRWMEVFYHYRGNLLTGGICIKEYLPLKRYGDRTNEYRVYYFNQIPITVSRNSLQGDYTPEPPKELIEKYRCLPSVFYTVDLADTNLSLK